MNPYQRLVADNYECGDYAHHEDPAEAEDAGDTLYLFLIRELEDPESPDVALRRITTARLQLQEMERVFHSTKSGLWGTSTPPEIEA